MSLTKKEKDKLNRIPDTIDDAVDNFEEDIPQIEKQITRKLNILLRELDIDNQGNVKRTIKNLKLTQKIQREVENMIMNSSYRGAVDSFVGKFDTLAKLNNSYFTLADKKDGV